MSRYFRASIKENRPLNENHNLLSLVAPGSMKEPAPGQFFMLQTGGGSDPLLKRAFSLFRRTADGFQILYRIKGKGTEILRDLKEGTSVETLGPLGNGYPLPSEDEMPLIIAGGVGIASVYSLAEKLSGKAHIFYGAKIERELFLTDELRELYEGLVVCTDDGSCGRQGTVVDVLDDFFREKRSKEKTAVIYACGPHVMLKAIAGRAVPAGIKAHLSLEEHMACGIGACLGCVVKTKTGYKRVCKEGPVFEARELEW